MLPQSAVGAPAAERGPARTGEAQVAVRLGGRLEAPLDHAARKLDQLRLEVVRLAGLEARLDGGVGRLEERVRDVHPRRARAQRRERVDEPLGRVALVDDRGRLAL